MKKTINIIGSGFSSLSASCYLAKQGYAVEVFEKNDQLGGRARQLVRDGFKFDMGPTWYWMPDVFERFFNDFGKTTSDYFELIKLGPAYRVYFGEKDSIDIQDSLDQILLTFESIEKGSGLKLNAFIQKARQNYDVAIKKLVYKPGLSPFELVSMDTVFELDQFYKSISDYVRKHFKDERLRQILEFPVLFLGAKPSKTPLFYSFMNYADFGLGTWYPVGGMKAVVDGMVKLARELGVKFHTGANVDEISTTSKGTFSSMRVNGEPIESDLLVSGADYHHTEKLLKPAFRSYSESYWQKRVLAPSSLLFYVGFSKPIKNVLHHTLFFDAPFEQHAKDIYDKPAWPDYPLFYASFPGKTDPTVVPEGKESAVFLIPLAPDLDDSEAQRQVYFEMIINRLEKLTGQEIKSNILFSESYGVQNFKDDYNSFKGNAYGLANTLTQTAFLRPKIKNKKVKNLYHTGQLTVPGPGVPPALISGRIVSELINQSQK